MRDLMKILMALMLAVFLCLSSLVGAITLDDTAEIQKSSELLADGFQAVKKVNVTVLPPDGVIYNITASSSNSILSARLMGVIAFSNLTYYHPEVIYGWIGIFIDKSEFFDIYSGDLLLIGDRRSTSQSEALKIVNNIINQRGTRDRISEHSTVSTYSDIQSYSKPSTLSSSITSSGSYPANKDTKVYHEPGCTWADKIKPENRIGFASPQQAEDAGYRHCKKC
jgi:hypothetical protein